MSILLDQNQQQNNQILCPISCEKVDEVIEYMKQIKETSDLNEVTKYLDSAHYCLFKIRDKEKGLI